MDLNFAEGLDQAVLDLVRSLPCGHVETCKELGRPQALQLCEASWEDEKPFTRPYSRVSALDNGGVPGEIDVLAYT